MIDIAKNKAHQTHLDVQFIVLDVFNSNFLPAAETIISVRFFNWLSLDQIQHLIHFCGSASIKNYILQSDF